ncbi:MAG: hypothetical protein AAFV26_00130, partial [Pseudomonadota bacterium]
YKDLVVFPVRVTPRDPARPVKLDAQMMFGVCKTICIPAEARHAATFTVADVRVFPPALAKSFAAIPETQAFGETGSPKLGVTAVRFADGKRDTLVVDVEHGKGADDFEAFIAPPTGTMFERINRQAAGAGRTRFTMTLPGWIPADSLPGKAFSVALKADAIQREVSLRVPN